MEATIDGVSGQLELGTTANHLYYYITDFAAAHPDGTVRSSMTSSILRLRSLRLLLLKQSERYLCDIVIARAHLRSSTGITS